MYAIRSYYDRKVGAVVGHNHAGDRVAPAGAEVRADLAHRRNGVAQEGPTHQAGTFRIVELIIAVTVGIQGSTFHIEADRQDLGIGTGLAANGRLVQQDAEAVATAQVTAEIDAALEQPRYLADLFGAET